MDELNMFGWVFIILFIIVLLFTGMVIAVNDLQDESSKTSKATKFFETIYLMVAGCGLIAGIVVGVSILVKAVF